MRQLSLAHLTIDDADPLAFIAAAAQAGFESVGLRVVSAPGAPPRPAVAGDDGLLARIKASLDASGLDVLQVNSFWIMPQTAAADFRPVLDAAARLQARHTLIVIGDPDLARAEARFAECCALAEPLGIGIALEFQSYSPVRTIAQALRMVEASGFAKASLVVDALHLDRSGGSPSDIAAVPAGRLAFAQLCDAPACHPPADGLRREAREGRLHPGDGELPLLALLDRLPEGIPLDVEAPSRRVAHLPPIEQARLAAEATRRLLSTWQEARSPSSKP
jgi:sugar phosphate isomerase/epimerase